MMMDARAQDSLRRHKVMLRPSLQWSLTVAEVMNPFTNSKFSPSLSLSLSFSLFFSLSLSLSPSWSSLSVHPSLSLSDHPSLSLSLSPSRYTLCLVPVTSGLLLSHPGSHYAGARPNQTSPGPRPFFLPSWHIHSLGGNAGDGAWAPGPFYAPPHPGLCPSSPLINETIAASASGEASVSLPHLDNISSDMLLSTCSPKPWNTKKAKKVEDDT